MSNFWDIRKTPQYKSKKDLFKGELQVGHDLHRNLTPLIRRFLPSNSKKGSVKVKNKSIAKKENSFSFAGFFFATRTNVPNLSFPVRLSRVKLFKPRLHARE